ncbi:MAG: tetratricopeptide repeat protein [Balneolaceae bacterium]|jgi:tetratricopeptide (TPR) repeat protein
MSRDLELEKRIDAYIKGKLTEEQSLQLWADLLERPDYIELLETELGLKSIFEKQSEETSGDTQTASESRVIYSLQRYWKWMASAAAVIILVVAVNILQVDTNQSLNELAVKKFNLIENLSSAKILRSQSTNLSPADSLLNLGFEAAIAGDIPGALATYEKIISEHGEEPAAVKAYLNKGLIQYNSGQFQESTLAFKHVLEQVNGDNPILKEKAYWYLGNAYLNMKQLQEARDAIHSVYMMDGIYRRSAFRLLKKLDYKLGNGDSGKSDP